MAWNPADSVVVLNDAIPLANVPEPMVVEPSLNVTVPVGTAPLPLPETVAVKVTDWPYVDGLGDDPRLVADDAFVTNCWKFDDVDVP